MLNSPLQEDFRYIIEKFGEPETIRSLEATEIESFRGKIPQALLTFWEHYGLCQFWGGLLRLSHPDTMRDVLSLCFGQDADLKAGSSHVVAHSAFGELYVWSETLQRVLLDLPNLRLRSRLLEDPGRRIADEDRAIAFLFAGEKRDFDFPDVRGKLLYDRCRSRHGPLAPDECYGFVPALMLGGKAEVASMRRVKTREHFAILAQLDRPTFVRIGPGGRSEAVRQIR